MRQAVEGTLVTASAEDPAIDWEASKIKPYILEGKELAAAGSWQLNDPDDGPKLKLKAKTGQNITEFRYRLLTDLEYMEMLRYSGENGADMMLLGYHVYCLCVQEVTRGNEKVDVDTVCSPTSKSGVGLRVWKASQLSGQDRGF